MHSKKIITNSPFRGRLLLSTVLLIIVSTFIGVSFYIFNKSQENNKIEILSQFKNRAVDYFLADNYSFRINNLPSLICNTDAQRHPSLSIKSGGVCESGLETSKYTLVMWKEKNYNNTEMQASVANQMMKSTISVPITGNLTCLKDETFKDLTGTNGIFVDCVNELPEAVGNINKLTYITFYYFTPANSSNIDNVLVFSDFGKGDENAKEEVFKRSREVIKNIELFNFKNKINLFSYLFETTYAGGGGSDGPAGSSVSTTNGVAVSDATGQAVGVTGPNSPGNNVSNTEAAPSSVSGPATDGGVNGGGGYTPPVANQTCWDGSVIPVTSSCPVQTQTCWDGSVIPVTSSCPTPTCANGGIVGAVNCPTKTTSTLNGNHTSQGTININCTNTTSWSVVRTEGGFSQTGSGSSGSINITNSGNYTVTCTGLYMNASTTLFYANYPLLPADMSINASPKTVPAGSASSISWAITNATSSCMITAAPVCSGTCSQTRLDAVAAINSTLQTGNTDTNDIYSISGVLRTIKNAIQTIAPNNNPTGLKALGKKTMPFNYTTDFTLDCGSGTQWEPLTPKKVRVYVSNDNEG